MKIKVTSTFVLDVSEDLELENFKAFCEAKSGFPASEFAIIARGQPLLENKKSLKDLGLQEGDEVILEEAGRRPENAPNMPLFGLDFSSIQVPGIAGANANVPAKTIADPAVVKEMFMSNPADMLRQQISEKKDREKQRIHASPLDTKAQRMIAEEIRQKNIEANLSAAIEYNSETFGTAVIICKVNGHFVKAFVDLSAQTTMMSVAAAKRCNIMRLVDHKCAGVAKGVGIRKITGRIHTVQIQIEDVFLASSFSVMEQLPMDMLLGLDMLRRHQCIIDLRENCLRIGTTNTQTTFLTESPEALKIKEALERSTRDLASTRGSGGASTSNETVTAQASDKFTEKDVAELMKLGFARDQVIVELRAFNGDKTQATAALFANEQPVGISIRQLCDSSLDFKHESNANKRRAVDELMSLPRVKKNLSKTQEEFILNKVKIVNSQLVRNYHNSAKIPKRMYDKFSGWFQTPFSLPAEFLVPQAEPPTEDQPQIPPIAADFDALTIDPSTSDLGALPASLVPPTELQDAANDVGVYQMDAIEEPIPITPPAPSSSISLQNLYTIECTKLDSLRSAAVDPIPMGKGIAFQRKSGYVELYVKQKDGTLGCVPKKFGQCNSQGEWKIAHSWTPASKRAKQRKAKSKHFKKAAKRLVESHQKKWCQMSKEEKEEVLQTAALLRLNQKSTRESAVSNYLDRRYDITLQQITSALKLANDNGYFDPKWREEHKPVKRLQRKRPLRRPTKKLFDWNIASKHKKTRIMLCAIKAYGTKEKLTKCINNYALNCSVKDIDNMIADMCFEGLAQEKWCHDRKLLLWSLTSKGKEVLGKRYIRYLQDDEEFFYRQFDQTQGAKGQTVDPENIVLNIQDQKKPHLPLSASNVKAWMGKMKGKGTLLRDSSKHGIKYESHGLEKLAELYPDSKMYTKKLYLRHKHLTAIPDAVMKVKKVDPVTGEIIEYDAFVEMKSPYSAVPIHDNKEKTFVERLLSLSYMELVQTGDGKWTFQLNRNSAYWAQIQGQLHASDPDAARDGKKVAYKKVDHAIFAVFIPILDPTTGLWTGKYELFVEEIERDQQFIDDQLVPVCVDYLEHGPSKKA